MSNAIHSLVGRPTNSGAVDQENEGNWIRWVRHDQAGLGQTTDYPSGGTMDLDNDGEIVPKFRAVLDISHGLSQVLGKQLAQTAIYRVVGLQVAARPVDDANDNNPNAAILFGGRARWITPTKHRVDAIQAARTLERETRADNVDSISYGNVDGTTPSIFGTSEKTYQGFRFGYRTEVDVAHPSLEGFTNVGNAVEGGAPSWCLFDDDGCLGIMSAYNEFIDGDDTSMGRHLWSNRIGSFTNTGIPFMIGWNNDEMSTPAQNDFNWNAPAGTHVDALGGLLIIDVEYSSVEAGGFVDDDYYLEVGVQIAGWSEF